MRNLLTHAIASLGLATLLVGSASAADMYSSNTQQVTGNPALQAQLERDAHEHNWLRQSPEGIVISRSDNTPQPSRAEQSAFVGNADSWLDRAPTGQAIGQAASLDHQAAAVNSYQDD